MSDLTRRQLLAAGSLLATAPAIATGESRATTKLKGNINHSVCAWCYKAVPLDTLAREAAAMGLSGVDLLNPEDFPTIQKYGLVCPMVNGPGNITKGWNDPSLHDDLVKRGEERLQQTAAAGYPNMIVFSGNRNGMADGEGLKNCATGLKRLLPTAEKLGVNIVMELLNSKVDHKDYMCDHTQWGVDLCNELGSPRFKLLYDIYHMQIMEGDIIRTIETHHQHIAHYHTGGVPGRNEINHTQELQYPAICKAIVATGYTGHLAQEFIPKGEPIAALREAVTLCDV